jgi:hypothetical protein
MKVNNVAVKGVDDGQTTVVDNEERTDTANGRAGVPEEG